MNLDIKDELEFGTLHEMLSSLGSRKALSANRRASRTTISPIYLTPDEIAGGFVVTCRDIPEVIPQGETVGEALAQAADVIDEALAGRLRLGDDIPVASSAEEGESRVPVQQSSCRIPNRHFPLAVLEEPCVM